MDANEKIREVTAKYEREMKEAEERALQARKAQSQAAEDYDGRLAVRQEQEARDAEHRARQELSRQTQQLQAVRASEEWTRHIDARIKLYFEQWFCTIFHAECEPVMKDIGEVLAKDRRVRREEDEAVVAEIKNCKLETKILPRIEAFEQRLSQYIGQRHRRVADRYTKQKVHDDADHRATRARAPLSTLPMRTRDSCRSENMVDKAEMDERLEQLNREWQCKYKELDDAWRRYLNNFAEETHREIAKVVGEGVATVIRDIETVDKIGRAIQAGFARLRAIDDLRTACGVDMRPDRTTSRPTTTSTGSILKSHRSGIAKTDPKEAYKAGFDAGYDCAITEARQIVGDLADRLAEDRKKYRAELKTLQADIEQLQAKIEQQPDPPPRLN